MTTRLIQLLLLIAAAQAASQYKKRGLMYELGEMHYAESEWQLQYNLKYSDYEETSVILDDCVNKLIKICGQRNHKLCDFFIGKTKEFHSVVKIDIEQLELYKRNKRFLFFIPLIILGVTSMALLSSLKSNREALQTIKIELDANLDMLSQGIETTKSVLNIHEQILADFEKQLINLSEAIERLNKKVDEQNYFTYILNLVTFSMIQHNRDHNRLMNLYDKKANHYLFTIINYGEYRQVVKELNKNLHPLFQVSPSGLNMVDFLKYSIEKDGANTTIHVRLPIIRKEANKLYEYIPVPFEQDGNLYILNMDTTLFYKNGKNEIFIPPKLDKYCQTIETYTICRNIMQDALSNPTQCFSALITNNATDLCVYKPLEKRNYAISISETALYYYVTEPTTIKLKCDNFEHVIAIDKSKLIEFGKNCNPFRTVDDLQNVTKHTEFHVDSLQNYPEIFEYDVPSQKWASHVQILDRYKLQLLETKNEYYHIQTDIQTHKEIISKIEINSGFFDSILDFFNLRDLIPVKYLEILFYLICILIVAYIIKFLILPLFKCKSKS